MSTAGFNDAATPTTEEADLARQSSRALAGFTAAEPMSIRVQSGGDDPQAESITIPATAFRMLQNILGQMAQGNAVTVLPVHTELTTQQAAEVLNVSRPFVIKLIEEKTLPCRMVGTHRRILLSDLLSYKRKIDADRQKVLEELAAQAQELEMGY